MAPFVSNLPRTFWTITDLEYHRSGQHDPYPSGMGVCEPANHESGNTIASLLAGSQNAHAPCIDIDWPCELTCSTTSYYLDIYCDCPRWYVRDEGAARETLKPDAAERLTQSCKELKQRGFAQRIFFVGGEEGFHYLIQFDLSASVVLLPSKSPHHHHLYIERIMLWEDYLKFIHLLTELGITEIGFRAMTERRGMSHLRKPPSNLLQVVVESGS